MNIFKLLKKWFCRSSKKKSSWGIIIPHTKNAQGATTKDGSTSEYEYALDMVQYTDFDFETRDVGGVTGAAERLFKKGYRKSLECHLNGYNSVAYGFELLIELGDSKSFKEALKISSEFQKRFPEHKIRNERNNGIKFVEKGDNGHGNLVRAKAAGMEVAILSEAFFIDNPKDWINPKDMAKFWQGVLS